MTPSDCPTSISPFSALIDGLDHGDFAREAAARLAEVVAAVETTGGKGSVTLTVAFERKKPGCVVVRPTCSAKVPREEPNAQLRYVGRGGELLESDPAQAEFDFQNVTPISPEPKSNLK